MKISNQLVPAFASTLLARIALGVGVSTVAIAVRCPKRAIASGAALCAIALTSIILPQATSAQTAPGTPGNALPDASRQNERDTFSGSFGSGDFSLFNLIHQSQLGTINMEEYSQEMNQNLSSEADKFKQQQLQLLGKPQPQLPANPDTNLQQQNQQDN